MQDTGLEITIRPVTEIPDAVAGVLEQKNLAHVLLEKGSGMAEKKMRFVLDSYAMISFLQREKVLKQ